MITTEYFLRLCLWHCLSFEVLNQTPVQSLSGREFVLEQEKRGCELAWALFHLALVGHLAIDGVFGNHEEPRLGMARHFQFHSGNDTANVRHTPHNLLYSILLLIKRHI